MSAQPMWPGWCPDTHLRTASAAALGLASPVFRSPALQLPCAPGCGLAQPCAQCAQPLHRPGPRDCTVSWSWPVAVLGSCQSGQGRKRKLGDSAVPEWQTKGPLKPLGSGEAPQQLAPKPCPCRPPGCTWLHQLCRQSAHEDWRRPAEAFFCGPRTTGLFSLVACLASPSPRYPVDIARVRF